MADRAQLLDGPDLRAALAFLSRLQMLAHQELRDAAGRDVGPLTVLDDVDDLAAAYKAERARRYLRPAA